MSSTLHPLERRVLETLKGPGSLSFDRLVENSRMDADQVRRSIQWLVSKGMVSSIQTVKSNLELVREPPELVLMDRLPALSPVTVQSLRAQFESQAEFSAAFGRAKEQGWITVEGVTPKITNWSGADALRNLIHSISSGVDERGLSPEQQERVADLIKRGLVRHDKQSAVSVSITDSGRQATTQAPQSDSLDNLTPNLLATGGWHGKKLRPINVEAKGARIYPGRRHPVRDFIKEVREAYISMGFTELSGDSVHPSFWNFDALFIPQDHPGRDMQDTLYLEGLSDKGMTRTGVVANVASTHEDGWKTGSRGWGYTWRIEEARRLVLRTHNTVLTVRALSESKEKETRVFAVSKVYRNENLDYKHLAEFHQMDGIIVGEGLNVRHLMGFLTEFYKKLGMKDVKLWPTYFPYTEPSLQVIGYSDVAKAWIELSGSGVFRPEVTIPLGVKVPVLAWGPGIERLMLLRYGLDDMRDLYGGDLSWLRMRKELASSTD